MLITRKLHHLKKNLALLHRYSGNSSGAGVCPPQKAWQDCPRWVLTAQREA